MTFSTWRRVLRGLVVVSVLATVGVRGAKKPEPPVKVTVCTDREAAIYACGETAVFRITVAERDTSVTAGRVAVALTLDGGRSIAQETLPLGPEPVTVSGTLDEPGFLRCTVTFRQEGRPYRGYGGAGFEPERIRAATPDVADFDAFWAAARGELAKIPLDTRLTPQPAFSDARQESFAISFANVDDTRVYGFLSVPRGRKPPFPAYVTVPGAGPGQARPLAAGYGAQGVLGLCVSVHAYEVARPAAEIKADYEALNREQIYSRHGAPDPRRYYFRRAILGVDRAITYLASRPDHDGRHLVMYGSSQGGGMTLILAGLNRHITAAAANVPALCDHLGARAERAPGWPRMVHGATPEDRLPYERMAPYFDAVNFARRITCPTLVSAGFIDRTCSPSSVYAAFNAIRSPKRMFDGPLLGHTTRFGTFPKFREKWIRGQLGLAAPVPPVAK